MTYTHKNPELAEHLNALFAQTLWQDRLCLLSNFPDLKKSFSTSYSLDDQVITHQIVQQKLDIEIFTLDTGRLFEAVQTLHQQTDEQYGITVKTYFPETTATENYVNTHGTNGFYTSPDLRHQCCFIRKVEPLKRALQGADIWVSGLRADHSAYRSSLTFAEWDTGNNVIKVYPVLDVAESEIRAFITENQIPFNPMYDNGYASIGCSPCTRAISAGEDPRAGRWWWEQGKKECGLHMVNGRLVRASQQAITEA